MSIESFQSDHYRPKEAMLWAAKGLQAYKMGDGANNILWMADDSAIPGGQRGDALRFLFSSTKFCDSIHCNAGKSWVT